MEENIYKHLSDMGLISKIYYDKELLQLKKKKPD